MTNIMIHGYHGTMGQVLNTQLKAMDVNVIPFDVLSQTEGCYKVLEALPPLDVIIDFSHYSCVDQLIQYAQKHTIPTVICTTGLSEDQLDNIEKAAETVPLFMSGNMSLGINVLIEMAKIGARVLAEMDVEIIEKHHNKKIDAPSGTALMIANAIKAIQTDKAFVYGRKGSEAKRDTKEIGIHAVRGGSITGEHSLLFAGLDETIEIKHQATSKAVFAKGAIEAAFFLLDKSPGLYNMTHLVQGV